MRFRLGHFFLLASLPTGFVLACGGAVSLGVMATDPPDALAQGSADDAGADRKPVTEPPGIGGRGTPVAEAGSDARPPPEFECEVGEQDYIGMPLPSNLDAICAASPARVAGWSTEAEATDCVRGQWLACPGMQGHAVLGVAAGIEFTTDKKIVRLILDGEGLVQRGTGIDSEGWWQYEWESIQLNWATGSGAWGLNPTFTLDPVQLRSDTFGRFVRP